MTHGTDANQATAVTTTMMGFRSDTPHRITIEPVEPQPAGWFQVLNVLVDHHLDRLTGADLKILLTILRHRDVRTNRTTLARGRADIARLSGLSKQAVSKTMHTLQGLRPPLLAIHDDGTLEAFPGIALAARAPRQLSTGVDAASTGVDARPIASTGVDDSSTGVDASKEVKTQDLILDDELVEKLKAGTPYLGGAAGRGFNERDARSLLTETKATRADVVAACRNADALARRTDPQGRLRDWRAYIAKQLRSGVTLFSALQQQDDDTRRNWDLVRRLLAEHGDTPEARAIAGWWNGLAPEHRPTAISGYIRAMSDDAAWRALAAKATRSST